MLTITRKLEFDAGHRIPDHKTANKRQKPTLVKLGIALTGRGERGGRRPAARRAALAGRLGSHAAAAAE